MGGDFENLDRGAAIDATARTIDALVVKWEFGIGAAILTFLASFIRWIVESSEEGKWDGTKVLDLIIW